MALFRHLFLFLVGFDPQNGFVWSQILFFTVPHPLAVGKLALFRHTRRAGRNPFLPGNHIMALFGHMFYFCQFSLFPFFDTCFRTYLTLSLIVSIKGARDKIHIDLAGKMFGENTLDRLTIP